MVKIIEAQDALAEARSLIDCICLSTESFPEGPARAIQSVANAACDKIAEAIALLDEWPDRGARLKSWEGVPFGKDEHGNRYPPGDGVPDFGDDPIGEKAGELLARGLAERAERDKK